MGVLITSRIRTIPAGVSKERTLNKGQGMSLSVFALAKRLVVLISLLQLGVVSFAHNDASMPHNEVEVVIEVDLKNDSTVMDLPFYGSNTALGATDINVLLSPMDVMNGMGEGYIIAEAKEDWELLVNQCIALINLFEYENALRSCNTAVALNPDSLMGYAGIYLTLTSHFAGYSALVANKIVTAITKIVKDGDLLKTASDYDKAWYEFSRAMLTSTISPNFASNRTYEAKLKALKKIDPENVELQNLVPWLTRSYSEKSIREMVLKYPEAVGPIHYRIHFLEGNFANGRISDKERAELQMLGAKLEEKAFNAPHAVHMFGHILPIEKKWSESAQRFEDTHQLHMMFADELGVKPEQWWHYTHNLELYSVTLFALGRYERALEVLELGCDVSTRFCSTEALEFFNDEEGFSTDPEDIKELEGELTSFIPAIPRLLSGGLDSLRNNVLNVMMAYKMTLCFTDSDELKADFLTAIQEASPEFDNAEFLASCPK